MNLEQKFEGYKEIYYKYFLNRGDPFSWGEFIPLERVNFNTSTGFAGDGTINIAQYLTFCYLNKNCEEAQNILLKLEDLIQLAYDYYKELNPKVYMKFENGFFLRDDIRAQDAHKFHLNKVESSYSRCLELINEDPCHSPFVSQDQIWNLLPILYTIATKGYYVVVKRNAEKILTNMLRYVIDNNHTIYNPYLSALHHHWTYLVPFKTNFSSRKDYRNSKLKYTIKVKRGANNWYFSYGFREPYKNLGNKCNTFWSSLWYKPFIFLADRVWHPYVCKWFKLPVKNNSYYCMGMAGAWYNKNYEKRLIKQFNREIRINKNPEWAYLIGLVSDYSKIDKNAIYNWLMQYPDPSAKGVLESPITFMILYSIYIKL